MTVETIAAAVIVNDRGWVLLVRRRRPEGMLLWTFPSGKIEHGEPPTSAAEREAREETGVTVRAERLLGDRVHPTTGRRLVYIACTPVAGTAHVAAPDEVIDVAWVAPDKLAAYGVSSLHPAVESYVWRR